MTIQERINRFCEKYPEPEQAQFKLYWERTDGEHEVIIGNGTPLQAWRRMFTRHTGKPLYMSHYRYDDETQLMECSYAVVKCTVPKPAEYRKWEYAERYFIPKESKEVYDINGNCSRYVINAAAYKTETYNARYFLQSFVRLNTCIDMFSKAFMALTNGRPDVPPRFENCVTHPWVMTEWIRYKPSTCKNSPTQKIIDELSNDELSMPSSVINAIKEKQAEDNNRYYWYDSRYAYYDKSNDVFRIYCVDDNITETNRVYHYKNKFITARLNSDNKWVKNNSFTKNVFNCKIVNTEDIYNMPYKSYLEDISCNTVYNVVSAIRNPEIEQLVNMGHNQLAEKITHSDSPISSLKGYLGNPINKNKNVCKRFGLTQKQLGVIEDTISAPSSHYRSYWNAVERLKTYLDTTNLSAIGDEFDRYYRIIVNNNDWNLKMLNDIDSDKRKKLFIKLSNMIKQHPDAIQICSDTIFTYERISLANRPVLSPYEFRNYDELVRMHDQFVEIKRIEDEEQRRLWDMEEAECHALLEKKMAKLDEKRKELNYEDDNYLIRIPTKLSEIVNEGASLHHCVGGYTDRHAKGDTTILFLRKKDMSDTSFYTIELKNDNSIQQIHGFCNKWLGNDPDAIPTVARWLRKNNIRCTDQILRGTAKGYCGNNILVDMPQI